MADKIGKSDVNGFRSYPSKFEWAQFEVEHRPYGVDAESSNVSQELADSSDGGVLCSHSTEVALGELCVLDWGRRWSSGLQFKRLGAGLSPKDPDDFKGGVKTSCLFCVVPYLSSSLCRFRRCL